MSWFPTRGLGRALLRRAWHYGVRMHREERDFTVVLHLRAEFEDDYAGDEDGLAWLERFDTELRPRLIQAIFAALAKDKDLQVLAAPRGRDPELGLDLDVVFKPR